MIAVVDYKKGNLLSVERGLREVGANAYITANPAEIAAASAIVLPGVGAFASAVETMNELGQASVIKQRISDGVPFLGICLGLHLLFDCGTEGSIPPEGEQFPADTACKENSTDNSETKKLPAGLGILSGCVRKMPKQDAQGNAHKVPHVGWNVVHQTGAPNTTSPLFSGIKQDEFFYFTHSYIAPTCEYAIANTTHSTTFPCAIQKGMCFAVQFHPEKSSDAGSTVLRNFVEIAKKAAK